MTGDHDWSVIFLNGNNEDLAFAFSALLNTDLITFCESDHVCFSQFKLFRNDRLVEHYEFGLECGKLLDDDYWDMIVECEHDLFSFFEVEEHKFCSSIREITAEKIKFDVDIKRNCLYDRGFLDSCLKHHNAYLPIYEETLSRCYEPENDLIIQRWDSSVEQLDIVMRSNYWSYYDRNVPRQVIKN